MKQGGTPLQSVPVKAIKRKIVINISQEVFDYIAKHGMALVDTPDSILRRLFGLPPKSTQGKEKL